MKHSVMYNVWTVGELSLPCLIFCSEDRQSAIAKFKQTRKINKSVWLEKTWFADGIVFNKQNISKNIGKTTISYYKNSKTVKTRRHYLEDKLHHESEPAVTIFYKNGKVKSVVYYFHGQLHKKDDAAIKNYDRNGNLIRTEYYLHGRKMSASEQRDTYNISTWW